MKPWIFVSIALLGLPIPAKADEPSQFIFAWPLDEKALKPRGATTRGAPVVLDTAPAEAWRRLNEPGLSARPALPRAQRAVLGRSARRVARARAPRRALQRARPGGPGQLFGPFFEYAAKLVDGAAFDRDAARAFIRRTLQDNYLK